MITLLYEVALDLYTFARDSILALVPRLDDEGRQPNLFAVAEVARSGTRAGGELPQEIFYMPPRVTKPELSAPGNLPVEAKTEEEYRATPIADVITETIAQAPQRNTIVYSATHGAPLRTSRETGIDNVLVRVPYGSMLVALESNGEWVRAFYHGTEGWIAIVDLADRAAHVYPKLTIGEKNLADDPNTLRIRAIINDEFSLGEGGTPLSAEEYVLYKLKRRGADVAWTTLRPRRAGVWASILETSGSATVGDDPKQRSLMEWVREDGRGHIAYVEAVFPDQSIQISEANWPDSGIYNERVLVKDEWQNLNPQFIYVV